MLSEDGIRAREFQAWIRLLVEALAPAPIGRLGCVPGIPLSSHWHRLEFSPRLFRSVIRLDRCPERLGDFAGNLILDPQHVVEWSVIGFRPDDVLVRGMNQPRDDS